MEQVIVELTALNKKADTIIGIMQKPENRFLKVLEILGNAAGVVGLLAVIEIIRTWIIGG
ncbi:MAG: hypothetical protein LBH44_05885 [Treponema sp.]|jgi:hypothetical protein|nr:hypothetical protein [Treponema sp.]